MIKKTILALILGFAVMFCTGCDDLLSNNDSAGYTPTNNSSSTAQVPRDYDTFWNRIYNRNFDWITLRNEVHDNENVVPITYEQLARSANGLFGTDIIVTGQIIQVIDDDSWYEGRINITHHKDQFFDYYEDTIFYIVPKSFVSQRILEGDIVRLEGRSAGLYSYTSTFGVPVTMPSITVTTFTFQ